MLFGKAAHPGVEVVAIDPHGSSIRSFEVVDGHEHEAEAYHKAFVENLERYGVADRIHYIRKSSHAALWDVDGAVELLYIDGSHNFGPARADMREWGSRLAVGSTMLIHDSFTSVGVTLAILATLVGSRRFSYVGRVGSLAEFRREDLRGRARWRGATALLGQLPYFGRNLVVEVLLILRLRGLTRYLGYDTSLDWPH